MGKYIIAYLIGGCTFMFMKGFSSPRAHMKTPFIHDWIYFVVWPYNMPSMIGSFGAALRAGKMED